MADLPTSGPVTLLDKIADIINPSLCWKDGCRCSEFAKNAAREKAAEIMTLLEGSQPQAVAVPEGWRPIAEHNPERHGPAPIGRWNRDGRWWQGYATKVQGVWYSNGIPIAPPQYFVALPAPPAQAQAREGGK